MTNPEIYRDRVQSQIDQYKDVEEIHDLPEIFDYWSPKYLLPKVSGIFGCSSRAEIFSNALIGERRNNNSPLVFASLGAGDCSIEIEIAQAILKSGVRDFRMDCFELSPLLLERAASSIENAELTNNLKPARCDVNEQHIHDHYDGVMAHFSLHHFVELERIFDNVKKMLRPKANFVIADAIGRNGHMRWPETLRLIQLIWHTLPDEKKFNRQFQAQWDDYVNWDCSGEGFEGIRAQDILPLIVERFHFSHFAVAGGLVDPFIDRGIGPNFDIKNKRDLAFIDAMQYLNQLLLEAGVIKPTMMFASVRNEPCDCKHEKNLTPAFCVRVPVLGAEDGPGPLFAPVSK